MMHVIMQTNWAELAKSGELETLNMTQLKVYLKQHSLPVSSHASVAQGCTQLVSCICVSPLDRRDPSASPPGSSAHRFIIFWIILERS